MEPIPPAQQKVTFDRSSRFFVDFFSRFKISPVQITFAFSLLIGLVAGLGAYGFKYLITWVEEICRLESTEGVYSLGPGLILLPALGGLVVGPLIYLFAREAKGHGVPEVMLAVLKKGGRIRPIVAVIKSIASALTIGTGGSAGSEGPIVQIGAGFGSTLGQLFRMPPQRIKTFVACGAAGGISAIFNAPFGGIMFSLEVILGEFRSLSFIYVALSSVIAALVNRRLSGNVPTFQIPAFSLASSWEIIAFFGLGVFTAFVAKAFIFILSHFEDAYERLKFPDYLKPVTGGAAVGLLAYFAPRIIPHPILGNPLGVLGVGYGTISTVMSKGLYPAEMGGEILWPLLVSLFLLGLFKILATSLTLGSGGSGGVFAPSLFVGAMAGGVYGILINCLFPAHTASPAVYALVGMGACFAGAAHAPITSIFILFEMTDKYEIILSIITAVVVSSLVSYWIKPQSVYTEKLQKKGVSVKREKVDILQSMVIKEVMIRKVQMVRETMTLKELMGLIGTKLHTSLPVVNENEELVGIITYKEIHQAMLRPEDPGMIQIKDFMNPDPEVAYPDEPVDRVFRRMKTRTTGFAPVIRSKGPKNIVGIVTYRNIFDAYEKALLD